VVGIPAFDRFKRLIRAFIVVLIPVKVQIA
jgi:hypothetical protein